eukprot:CAMPEP_0119290104 /NCGR_PEP_ID=MMETSP1329-20130426/40175_1 /TAXON_ID=114041 /ORGANISM="Genus nov. species nov., Strain RCC1024" /LENGTH=103 /DNA_ID=CAMNT_0007290919 /DNA_START=445 /DNA_END=756 /DNA_ORIENTATION=+
MAVLKIAKFLDARLFRCVVRQQDTRPLPVEAIPKGGFGRRSRPGSMEGSKSKFPSEADELGRNSKFPLESPGPDYLGKPSAPTGGCPCFMFDKTKLSLFLVRT